MARYIENGGRGGEHGYTYIALLILIAVMSMGLAVTGEVWHTAMKREKEEQLLFVGNQFRNALTLYYLHTPGGSGRYPLKLEDLLKDPRYPAPKRYLRKIYVDPLSNSDNWELLKGANGEILGVHSTSEEEPLKKSNFSLANQSFEGAKKYSEWVFAIPLKFVQPAPIAPAGSQPSGLSNPGPLMQGIHP